MDEFSLVDVEEGTSSELRQRLLDEDYSEEKGHDIPSETTKSTVNNALGGTIMDLRSEHRKVQQRHSTSRNDYASDSDSDSEFTDKIKSLADEDTTWFKGCGFRFTVDFCIILTQIIVGLAVVGFCFMKLYISDDCSTMSAYAPLLGAVVGFFLPGPNGKKKEKSS